MSRHRAQPGILRDLTELATDLAFLPLRAATSPLARRVYLSSFLLFVTSIFLLFVSSVAYVLFYHAYVPHAVVSVPIYLQYAHGTPSSGTGSEPVPRAASHPFGTALLTPGLSPNQKYDVEVVLDMPRSPVNRRAGNFMVEVALLAPGPTTAPVDEDRAAQAAPQYTGGSFGEVPADALAEVESVVVRARRPAILKYSSLHVDLVRQAAALPWYALGLQDEREEFAVGMLEEVEFAAPRTRRLRGGAPGVPDRVRVTLEGRELLEVYRVRVEVTARLRGLRWLMYRHRILTFVAFTGMFFSATMGSALAVFAVLTIRKIMQENQEMERKRLLAADSDSEDDENNHDHGIKTIKQEGERDGEHGSSKPRIKNEYEEDDGLTTGGGSEFEGLSDTSRQFPTGYGKPPLRFFSSASSGNRGRARDRDGEGVLQSMAAGSSASAIKREDGEEAAEGDRGGNGVADDEDNAEEEEEDDYEDAGADESFRDSGIGTGREEREATAAARRRKRGSVREEGR